MLGPTLVSTKPVRRRRRSVGIGALLTMVLAFGLPTAASAATRGAPKAKPTIVLAHGAFADASSWNGVIGHLQKSGYPVLAPAIPLRGVASDSAYLASVVATIEGPVILAGHSYAGAVIGVAAATSPNVKGLVYVDGLALDVGESAESVGSRFTDNLLGPALRPRPFPVGDGTTGTDLYVAVDRFPAIFGADLPRRFMNTLAVAQRPIAANAFKEPVTAAAWRTIPASFVFGRHDRAIDPAELEFLARRAKGPMTIVNGSHLSLISHADAVAKVIERAATRAASAR